MTGEMHRDAELLTPVVASVLSHAVTTPETVALIAGNDVLTYLDLRERVGRVADALLRKGIQPCERVLVQASSDPAFVVSYLATHLVRAVAVPVDTGMPRTRVDHIADRVSARLVLSEALQREMLDDPAATSTGFPRHAGGALAGPANADAADIMFTSGTTGPPKGVMLGHRSLAAAARRINSIVGTRRTDVEVLPLPLGHSFGLGTVRCVLSVGATVVLVEGFAFPGRIFAAMEQHRATAFRCVPAGLAMMLRLSADRLADFAGQLRYMELGSAPMRLEDKRHLMALLPHSRICMHYGLTEATRSAYLEFHADSARLESVGRPGDDVAIRVAAPDGRCAAPGEPGEIQIRGPHVMSGYWQDAERTAGAFAGDWLRTGDGGHMDAQGYLYLRGRNAELINVGGRKVAPNEVEEALRTHPAVLDCACSGIEDPTGVSGDAVAVLVLLRDGLAPGKRELREHLRTRLEPYKLPVRWLFSGSIPRTPNGKLQRHLLRELLERTAEP